MLAGDREEAPLTRRAFPPARGFLLELWLDNGQRSD